jgi:uncharacterized delta-60 repeat protein
VQTTSSRGRISRQAAGLIFGLMAFLGPHVPGVAAQGNSGLLDPTFGDGGIALTPGPENEVALGLARDGHGRLVAVGTTRFEDFVVRRYRASGSPDLSFGEGGEVQTSFGQGAAAKAVVVQPDGKILAAGGAESAFALARYGEEGRADQAFGKSRRVLTPGGIYGATALDVAIQPSGRILAAGYGIDSSHRWTGLLIAYRSDGSIAKSFASGGMFKIHGPRTFEVGISGVEILPSGKILLGGDFDGRLMLVRLLPSGKLDRSFGGGDGRVMFDADGDRHCACSFSNSLAIGPGGRPLLAGSVSGPGPESGLLARFLPTGKPDRSFGNDGVVRTLRGSRLVNFGVTVQPNKRIVIAGAYDSSRTGESQADVLRFLPSGKLDSSFGRSGFFAPHVGRESVAHAVLSQPDGRVVVAGRANVGRPSSSERESALDGAGFLLMRLLPGA